MRVSLSVRVAQPDDLPAVVDLVQGMFVDLGTPDFPISWRESVTEALTRRMGRDASVSLAVDADVVVAVAVGLIEERLPSPRRPSGKIGYVEWLATHSLHRRRGAARLAMADLLGWFASRDVQVIDVHASVAARGLYEQLGFALPAAASMRRRA